MAVAIVAELNAREPTWRRLRHGAGRLLAHASVSHSSPFEFILSPGPLESRPVPGVEWAQGAGRGADRVWQWFVG